METRFRNWLATLGAAYPSAFSAYWRALPISRMKSLLAGAFFIGAVAGFASDLLQITSRPLGGGFYWPISLGLIASGILVTLIKTPRLVLPTIVLTLLIFWAGGQAVQHSAPVPISDTVHRRIAYDAIGVMASGILAYRLLLFFISTEGLANIRAQTELALAHGIQTTLVPTISIANAGLEVYGKSLPSAEMGGDLLDVIQEDSDLLAYVADISGHGLPAGQLMGMLKAAVRAASHSHSEPSRLLEIADRVLPSLKDPSMYATIAMIRFDGSTEVEYALAGHLPILYYEAGSRETKRLSVEEFPLGLVPGGHYHSARVSCSRGDVFALITDGVSEVVNAADQEFGLSGVELLLAQHAGEPLPKIWQTIVDSVQLHGRQMDDQSLLLIRLL